MFFNRSGFNASSSKHSASASGPVRDRRHRRFMALGLAVALALPVGLIEFNRLYAQDSGAVTVSAAATQSDELLKQGVEQLEQKQYEEAQATLSQIKPESLPAKSRKELARSLAEASAAAAQRQAARGEFQQGEAALQAGQPDQAVAHYKAAARNRFADQGTRRKALEQLALGEKAQEQAKAEQVKVAEQAVAAQRAAFAQAVAEYKAGNLADAKVKFQSLKDGGFEVGWFQKGPGDYLRDIAKQQAAPKPIVVVEATKPVEAGRAAYTAACDQYHKGDWIAARKNFQVAQAPVSSRVSLSRRPRLTWRRWTARKRPTPRKPLRPPAR